MSSSLSTNLTVRNRKLQNEADVFTQNAWDDTEWTAEMVEEAEARLEQQRDQSDKLDRHDIEQSVTEKWDKFYEAHGDKFFKDRRWIFSEFPEILDRLNSDSQATNLLEVGCGVGNAVTHILASNRNPYLHIYCCDLSHNAIKTLRNREVCKQNEDKITAFQANICTDFDSVISNIIEQNRIDFMTIIFTLSALKPDAMKATIGRLVSLLKPDGMILFRDYARYDLTQLRFKAKAYLADNYYLRADGTTSYFFTPEFVEEIFCSNKLSRVELKEDNRMLINRLKCLKMCRRWIQGKFRRDDRGLVGGS